MNGPSRLVAGTVVNVTPNIARDWLKKNTRNRAVRRAHVAKLALQMQRGEWRLTHQGIAFDANGALLDGQHRLEAVAASGVTVPMLVFHGWEGDTFGVLDKGVNRSIRDDLMRDGRLVEPATFLCKLIDKTRGKTTSAEVQRMLTAIQGDLQAVRGAAGSNGRGRTAAPMVAAVALRYREANAEGRDYILRQWAAWVGLDVPAMSPSIAALVRRADSVGSDKGSQTAHERGAIAWIAFNPLSRNLAKIQIREISNILAEIRDATTAALQAAQQQEIEQ